MKGRTSLPGTCGSLSAAIRAQLSWSNLTAQRERHLLCVYRTMSDDRARQAALTELWESHSKLVVAIAIRYRQPSIELADLIGAGHLGLHTAIARFDPRRFDGKLATYAIPWIRWHIQDYARRNATTVPLPATTAHRKLAQMAGRLFADASRSCQREHAEATESELWERIGQRIGLDSAEVARSIRLMSGGAVSIHGQLDDQGMTRPLGDSFASDCVSPEDDVILRLDHAKARKRIRALAYEILGEREKEIFLARSMSDSDEVPRLEELAERFGVTRERVCQLEASARRKIAMALAREGYADFDADKPLVLPTPRARRRRRSALSTTPHRLPCKVAAAV